MNIHEYTAINSFTEEIDIDGVTVLKVIKDPKIKEFDEPTFARKLDLEFHNGIIEVKVLSRLLSDAPDFARGFIGIAFRINDQNSEFEALYIRPTNGRSDNQFRRNHSTQYFSYPDYKFERLRKEADGFYESYADMDLNEWIDIKIKVQGKTAKLYVNNSKYPVLLVNDLKHGDTSGGVALWVEVGTEGFFKDLYIHPTT